MASQRQSQTQQPARRSNRRTALLLTLLAVGFYVAFFWSMSHRH